jgi:ribosomal protein S9
LSTPIEYYATGKRKTAIARVRLRAGTGEVHLNDKALDDYFGGHEALKMVTKQPFAITETTEKFDVLAIVTGGGPPLQAGRHPSWHLARALRVQPRAAQAPQEGGIPHRGTPASRSARSTDRRARGAASSSASVNHFISSLREEAGKPMGPAVTRG